MRKRRGRHEGWAAERFGGMQVDDQRIACRAVKMTATLARRPRGTVTEVFEEPSEREAAYRFLENDRVTTSDLEVALGNATARACASEAVVFVPVDGTSLNLVDRQRTKGFGVVGSYQIGARGIIVQTALAVSEDGTTIDVAGQRFWTREPGTEAPSETLHVAELVTDVLERMTEHAPETKVWFQFDRGYDGQPMLSLLSDLGAHFTVRSNAHRRVEDASNGQRRYLDDVLRGKRALGEYVVALDATDKRPARHARVVVRAAQVTLAMRRKSKAFERVTLWVVEAKESGRSGLSWRLLTSEPAGTFEEAMRVVRAYESRWRIEEFHRAWKSGVCRVEDTQLRSLSAVTKWATLHATVAARATRLAQLAREKPDLPADVEFSRSELIALVALAKKKRLKPTDPVPSLGVAVEMVARLGGYIGKSSGGPPGATTVGRGLTRVLDLASALAQLFDDG